MNSLVKVFITTPLKASSELAAQAIRSEKYDALFLTFHKDIEYYLYDLAEGEPLETIVEKILKKNLIAEPSAAWIYWAEPVLKALEGLFKINPSVEILCVEESYEHEYATTCKVDLAVLEFKGILGRVDIEQWRKLLHEYILFSLHSSQKKVDFIAEEAKKHRESLCISFNSGSIKRLFKILGIKVQLKYTMKPYFFLPPQVLQRVIRKEMICGEAVPDNVLEELIEQDIDFISNYLQSSKNIDEAYEKWIKVKRPKKPLKKKRFRAVRAGTVRIYACGDRASTERDLGKFSR